MIGKSTQKSSARGVRSVARPRTSSGPGPGLTSLIAPSPRLEVTSRKTSSRLGRRTSRSGSVDPLAPPPSPAAGRGRAADRCWRSSPGCRRPAPSRPIALRRPVGDPVEVRNRIIVSRPSCSPSVSGAPLGDDPALAQDHHPVGEVLGLVHVVGGEDDRRAELLQALDHVPGVAPGRRIEAGGRLVEEEQLGVADDPDAHVDRRCCPPDSARRARPRLSARPTSSSVSSTGRGVRKKLGVQCIVSRDREQRVELAFLQDQADPRPPLPGRRGPDRCRARRPPRPCARGSPRGSRSVVVLPAPLGPRKPNTSPLPTSKSIPLHRLVFAVGLVQAGTESLRPAPRAIWQHPL